MDRTLRDHIAHLDTRLRELTTQIMDNTRTLAERNRIESEIRAAELAISYYKKALELEGQVSG
jgi:hypothetical protein